MLVVDINTLILIYTLYLHKKVIVYAFNAFKSEDIMRVQRTAGYIASGLDLFAFSDCYPRAVRNDVFFLAVLAENMTSVLLSGLTDIF